MARVRYSILSNACKKQFLRSYILQSNQKWINLSNGLIQSIRRKSRVKKNSNKSSLFMLNVNDPLEQNRWRRTLF